MLEPQSAFLGTITHLQTRWAEELVDVVYPGCAASQLGLGDKSSAAGA